MVIREMERNHEPHGSRDRRDAKAGWNALELDEKPNLTPGRVQVVVQPLSTPVPTKRGLLEVMDEIRASQRDRGYQGRSLDAMEADDKARKEENAEYDRR